jgi:ribose 5-phosphate isomerase B
MARSRQPGASASVASVDFVRIAIGSDHAGFGLKEQVAPMLESAGHEVIDVGTNSDESVDYAQFAAPAAQMVAEGDAERAVVVCGSGVGVSIVANKVEGVRAVNAHDPEEAEMSRRHNNANVLALAGRRLETAQAQAIVERFLETDFEGGRHERRVDQIGAVERGETP